MELDRSIGTGETGEIKDELGDLMLHLAFQIAIGEEKGEFYALLLWGHLGVSIMTRGLDLLLVFIGLRENSLTLGS